MDDSILCAGNMNVSIGSCNGDSGGPLTYFNGTHTVLVGVVSFGIDIACAIGVPDGFSRVSKEIDWIKNNGDEYVKTCSGRA